MTDTRPHVGTVAMAGRPNVGKSSLANALLEYHLSIVTAKPQTTRDVILGLFTDDEAQVLFLDTPGVHKPEHVLGHRLVERAEETLKNADLVCFVLSVEDRLDHPANRRVLEAVKKSGKPCVVALNKADLPGGPAALLPLMAELHEALPQAELIPCSAKTGLNRDLLLNELKARLPEGPLLFPEDQLTDRSERFIASEVLRQVAMEATEEEVPHSIAVEIDEYCSPDEYPREDLYVRATYHVERSGQKGILLGAEGKKIKSIRQRAAKKLKALTGWPVKLDLWVKVTEGWRDNERQLKRLGYGPEKRPGKE